MTPEEEYARKYDGFIEWSSEHPDVWVAFEHLALDLLIKGHRDFSAWAIMNIVRWQRIKDLALPKMHVRNDFIAFYARKFMAADPLNRGGFFEIKKMKGEDFGATKFACGVK